MDTVSAVMRDETPFGRIKGPQGVCLFSDSRGDGSGNDNMINSHKIEVEKEVVVEVFYYDEERE